MRMMEDTWRRLGIQVKTYEVKVSLFSNEIIVYISDPKSFIRKFLHLIDTFSIVA